MSNDIKIMRKHDYGLDEVFEMYRLRAHIYKDRVRCKFDMPIDMEMDQYDELDPYYLFMKSVDGKTRGCWRLLRTDGPYMLKDVFPDLLGGINPPNNKHVWELSKFVILTNKITDYGINVITIDVMRKLIEFGHKNNVTYYITAATTSLEQILLKAGVILKRLSPVVHAGPVKTVGLCIDIGCETYDALYGKLTAYV